MRMWLELKNISRYLVVIVVVVWCSEIFRILQCDVLVSVVIVIFIYPGTYLNFNYFHHNFLHTNVTFRIK